jgi:hypothetical protein
MVYLAFYIYVLYLPYHFVIHINKRIIMLVVSY